MTDPDLSSLPTTQRRIARGFQWLEKLLYIALGMLLGLIAVAYLAFTVYDFAVTVSMAHFSVDTVTFLGRLLLVLLIIELLYTVQVSYTAGTLVLEPFLFVGLIAAIRRIFVLTAQFAETKAPHVIPFDHFVIELASLSGLILILTIALWLVRHSEKRR